MVVKEPPFRSSADLQAFQLRGLTRTLNHWLSKVDSNCILIILNYIWKYCTLDLCFRDGGRRGFVSNMLCRDLAVNFWDFSLRDMRSYSASGFFTL